MSPSLGTSRMKTFASQGISASHPLLSVFTFDLSEFCRHRCCAHHRDELPIALHTIGVAPFLFGNTIVQGPSLTIRLRKPTSTGSLRPHVFNTVNNLPYQTSGKYTTSTSQADSTIGA